MRKVTVSRIREKCAQTVLFFLITYVFIEFAVLHYTITRLLGYQLRPISQAIIRHKYECQELCEKP